MVEKLFNLIVENWISLSVASRVFGVCGIFILLFFLIRIGAMGVEAQNFSHRLVAIHIPIVDPPVPSRQISVQMKILKNGEYKEFQNGAFCPSSSLLKFSISGIGNGWLTMFGRSNKGVYALEGKGIASTYYEKEFTIEREIRLDWEKGIENFGFLFSPKEISQGDLREYLIKTNSNTINPSSPKGGNPFNLFINIPNNIARESKYCVHN